MFLVSDGLLGLMYFETKFFGDYETDSIHLYYLNLFCYILACFASGFMDASFVGYLKCFHPEISDYWGVGMAVAQSFSVLTNMYTNEIELGPEIGTFYLWLGIASCFLPIILFEWIESIRLTGNQSSFLSTVSDKSIDVRTKQQLNLNHFTNDSFTIESTISIFKRLLPELCNMFILQFFNDIYYFMVVLIDINNRNQEDSLKFLEI